jgi:hypothetical protein
MLRAENAGSMLCRLSPRGRRTQNRTSGTVCIAEWTWACEYSSSHRRLRALAPTGASYRVSPGSRLDFARIAEYELRSARSHAPPSACISAGSGWPWAVGFPGRGFRTNLCGERECGDGHDNAVQYARSPGGSPGLRVLRPLGPRSGAARAALGRRSPLPWALRSRRVPAWMRFPRL